MALFAGLKFYVKNTASEVDIVRRAEVIAVLKAQGGEVLDRLEALKLPPGDVMRLVVDAFTVPDKDTGIAFYDAQWALSSAKKGQLLDREVYRLKPLAAPAPTGGAKRKYLRYTEADDDALRAFVAARPTLKPTGLKIWDEAKAQKVTEHSMWSMKERYATLMGWGKGAAKAEVKREKAEEGEARQPPAKAAKAAPPRKRAASEDEEEAVAAPAPAKKRAVAAEAADSAPVAEPLARALAPKADAPSVAYTTVVDADEVDDLVAALCKAHTATLGEALHALYTTAGDFDDAAAFLRLSKGRRELEVARGWSATDDRVLQATAREPPPQGAPLPSALRGRKQEQVEQRCHFLGCVLPRLNAFAKAW